MKPESVSSANLPETTSLPASSLSSNESQSFDAVLKTASPLSVPQSLMSESRPITFADADTIKQPAQAAATPAHIAADRPFRTARTDDSKQTLNDLPSGADAFPPPASSTHALRFHSMKSDTSAVTSARAAAAYQQAMQPTETAPAALSDLQKYKDDQLLRNPGGRNYYLDKKVVAENLEEQKSFVGRVGKDISSALGNIKNFLGNIFLGSKFLYRGENNEIKEGRQKGLLSTLGNFFKDLGSALSFGAWHPGEKEAPTGILNRLVYSSTKLKDAVVGGLVEGIPASLNHMGKNLVLAGWHLAQVVPDATIGNFDAGRKLTTSVFDNGHVLVEYITDVMPSGDAWLRVHASSLKQLEPPLVYNLKMPENYTGDTRWEYVRNTPFRKSIESLGAILADIAAIGLVGQSGFSSNRHQRVMD